MVAQRSQIGNQTRMIDILGQLESSDPGKWFWEDKDTADFFPLGELFAEIPSDAQEWQNIVKVNWTSPHRVVIAKPVPGAPLHAIVHQSEISTVLS